MTTMRGQELQAEHLARVMAWYGTLQRVLETHIQGRSMGATIADGARIRLQCGPASPYRRGDIVVYLVRHRVIVHRVVYCGRGRRARHYLITQGDGMLWPDAPVPVQAVLGRVTAIQHEGHWQPPQALSRPSLWRWLVARGSLLLLGLALEAHVMLARWLAPRLRLILPALRRRLPGRSSAPC